MSLQRVSSILSRVRQNILITAFTIMLFNVVTGKRKSLGEKLVSFGATKSLLEEEAIKPQEYKINSVFVRFNRFL